MAIKTIKATDMTKTCHTPFVKNDIASHNSTRNGNIYVILSGIFFTGTVCRNYDSEMELNFWAQYSKPSLYQ
jgi:hypothetical protein